jgi:hypothetical protein
VDPPPPPPPGGGSGRGSGSGSGCDGGCAAGATIGVLLAVGVAGALFVHKRKTARGPGFAGDKIVGAELQNNPVHAEAGGGGVAGAERGAVPLSSGVSNPAYEATSVGGGTSNPAYEATSVGGDAEQQRERSTTETAYAAREDPAGLVGQRIDVAGKGAGVVTGLRKAKGKSTMVLVRFANNPTAAPEAVLLQKKAGGKGCKFHILLE